MKDLTWLFQQKPSMMCEDRSSVFPSFVRSFAQVATQDNKIPNASPFLEAEPASRQGCRHCPIRSVPYRITNSAFPLFEERNAINT